MYWKENRLKITKHHLLFPNSELMISYALSETWIIQNKKWDKFDNKNTRIPQRISKRPRFHANWVAVTTWTEEVFAFASFQQFAYPKEKIPPLSTERVLHVLLDAGYFSNDLNTHGVTFGPHHFNAFQPLTLDSNGGTGTIYQQVNGLL